MVDKITPILSNQNTGGRQRLGSPKDVFGSTPNLMMSGASKRSGLQSSKAVNAPIKLGFNFPDKQRAVMAKAFQHN